MYDAQNSINIVNHTTVRVQFLSRSKNKSRGLKLAFDIKDITLAEITITTSYYFFLTSFSSHFSMKDESKYGIPFRDFDPAADMGAIHSTKFSGNFGPTGKVSKKRVHLLRWTTFPGRTDWNFR